MHDVKVAHGQLEAMLSDVRQSVIHIEATLAVTLPYFATKAELADKPGKTCLAGLLAAPLTAYTAGLAARVILK